MFIEKFTLNSQFLKLSLIKLAIVVNMVLIRKSNGKRNFDNHYDFCNALKKGCLAQNTLNLFYHKYFVKHDQILHYIRKFIMLYIQ